MRKREQAKELLTKLMELETKDLSNIKYLDRYVDALLNDNQ